MGIATTFVSSGGCGGLKGQVKLVVFFFFFFFFFVHEGVSEHKEPSIARAATPLV
eukprot:NODE_27039_length_528_cov_0.910224.p3 GENE.NODE_27039_length_528_cov_0.910224~~NODE_27039_length_528_cov_0.910224.p3  ORF type:complete len:55 (+),score=8.16 NODE_27039_length_528_cov_0.910224:69-233(+)